MQARGGKGRGRCTPGAGNRLAIQKKRLHGAGRIMASRADDFFRGEPRRRDDRASLHSSILSRGKVERDASAKSVKAILYVRDWKQIGRRSEL